jgi:hypothetical protein
MKRFRVIVIMLVALAAVPAIFAQAAGRRRVRAS